MVSASNCISQQADADGAEYTYRVNDDTVFETAGWLDALPAALQALDPPNVGVVGPQASGGNWKVLTYDAVHRSHLEIFGGHRYPAVFKNWYSDDWISKVTRTPSHAIGFATCTSKRAAVRCTKVKTSGRTRAASRPRRSWRGKG